MTILGRFEEDVSSDNIFTADFAEEFRKYTLEIKKYIDEDVVDDISELENHFKKQ